MISKNAKTFWYEKASVDERSSSLSFKGSKLEADNVQWKIFEMVKYKQARCNYDKVPLDLIGLFLSSTNRKT